ncbi:hypothetical protein V2K55_03220 [Pseudomonas alliivorans]|nr:hypothetical protein [Pseudomonas alliivorans]MEE4704696.1 hypothetical protein [Pseudomonas alliivorans]MEE4775890.1 hypothetical protein [Pseudomonas alliivorans]MEE5162324.1 hypothetical protein [Pseudomonas alliivorans]
MTILSYPIGPISAEAAFTSDFPVAAQVEVQKLINMQEIERRSMDVRPGMRHKYMPLSYDRVTGALLTGGRYLFDTWENVLDYKRFTSEELEFEPGVKFWSRPFFLDVDRHIWRVAGAHDFKPLASTHHVNRFERWSFQGADVENVLKKVWPTIRDEAESMGLSSAWLMFQPEERQIGIVTVAARHDAADPAEAVNLALTALQSAPSLERLLPPELKATKLFDRTSPILSLWLPQSRLAGGEPSAHPLSPPFPAPTVEPQR